MNILYLLKILDTDKVSELVANIDAPPLDMNLAIWEAIDRGEIEIDEEKSKVTALKEAQPSSDPDLVNKIIRTVQHYAKNGTNITRGRLNGQIKDPASGYGYPWHDYLMAMQHLIDQGTVVQDVIEVPKSKNRPAHKFAFIGLPENDNAEMNAKAVNKWIDDIAKAAKNRVK